jgi:hypothetical protein
MKTIINSPIFYFSDDLFYGDNVAHYLPAKYLWYTCNVAKKGFYQPIYNFVLDDTVKIDFAFYPEQPQHLYFKKPKWINEFVVAKDYREMNGIAKEYDYFVNNYRYRRFPNSELNWGYSDDLKTIELYLTPYTYKANYDYDIYIDDLELEEKYKEFIHEIHNEINPDKRELIVIQFRGADGWNRHLPKSVIYNEKLLFNLLKNYPEAMIILVGEGWKYYHSSRVRYLHKYINRNSVQKKLKEYSHCLQYILAAYFCRNIETIFVAISGFSSFLASIRPNNLRPIIPIFWGRRIFDAGVDTCLEKMQYSRPKDLLKYRKEHFEDVAFLHDTLNFMYYNRDEEILLPYCKNFPNTLDKIAAIITKLDKKYLCKGCVGAIIFNRKIGQTDVTNILQRLYGFCINILKRGKRAFFLYYDKLRSL